MHPRLLDEFCDKGKLEPHRETLFQILSDIHENGCKVSARYDADYSNIDPNTVKPNHIRISLSKVSKPLDVIWILLHEYGHYLSGPRKTQDTKIYREELAWQLADNELKKYVNLHSEMESYETCKNKCLQSYYNKFKL